LFRSKAVMVCVPAANFVVENSPNRIFAAAGRNEEVGLSVTVARAVVIPWKLSDKVTGPVGKVPAVAGVKVRSAAMATDWPANGCVGLRSKEEALGVDFVMVNVGAIHETSL